LKNTPKFYEILIAVVIIAIVNIFSYYFQPVISFNDGKGMDGVEYCKIAEDFTAGIKPETRAPFVYRIGTPFLVSIFFQDNLVFGFKIINIIAGSLIPIALLFWISLYFHSTILRLIPILLYSLTWHSPLRLSWYYPVHTDPAAIFILLILMIFLFYLNRNIKNEMDKPKFSKWYLFISFTLLTYIGIFFREICLIPALIFALSSIKINFIKQDILKSRIRLVNYKFLFPLFFGLLGVIIVHYIANKTNSYSFFAAAFSWIYRKSIFMNFHALLIAFGPIIFLPIISYKDSLKYLIERKDLLIFLIIIFIMGFAGGSDTERILYWSFPVVYLLLINSIIENKHNFKSTIFIILIFIGQIINMRILWATPDYPNNYPSVMPVLTPLTDKFPLLDLWTWHGDLKVNLVSFAGYIVLFVIVIITYLYSLNKSKN
jgi:hypothetical protein